MNRRAQDSGFATKLLLILSFPACGGGKGGAGHDGGACVSPPLQLSPASGGEGQACHVVATEISDDLS
jgi:hypothetical protein